MRGALQPLGRRLKQLRAPDEMWSVVIEAAKVLGAVAVDLRLDSPGSPETAASETYTHGTSESEADESFFQYQFLIPGNKQGERVLVLGWTDGRMVIDRDTEIAAEIFCEHLGVALDFAKSAEPLRVPAQRAVPRV